MGAGASVLQDGDDGVLDLDTFALVQQEYRRLSCPEAPDGVDAVADADAPRLPSDEEVFVRLKSVVVQRYELKHHDTADINEPTNDTEDHAPAEAKDNEASGESELPDGPTLPIDDIQPDDLHNVDVAAKEDDGDGEALAVRMLQRPLTAETLLALADAIPVDDDETDALGGDAFQGPGADVLGPSTTHVSLSEGSLGRHPANLSSLSSASSTSATSSTFDLSQNLTPVFTTDVLTDPTTLKMITSYAERERIQHGGDWIKFWVEIDELAQLPSHSYTHRRLRKIYDKFLSPEAPSPVCVTSNMLSEIESALQGDNISAGIYADAQQICLTALEQSVFPRFRENRLFKKMIDFCAPSQATTRQLQQQQQQNEPEDYSLQGILAHPAKLRFLKTYCMEALALENLLFYLEVEDCKRLPNLSFIVNKTRKIYDRYCTASSRNFLGLPDLAFAELHAAAEANQALLPKLFYEAQLLVFQRISEEVWKNFSRTSEYLEYSRKLKPEHRRLPYARNAVKFSPEQSEQLQKKLDAMNEFQLIEAAMHYPVAKLIPLKSQGMDGANTQFDAATVAAAAATDGHAGPVFTPAEQLTILLGDSFGKKFFKQFMHKRGVDHFLAFCHEVDDFKLLPGIEFLQHTAKKIYRKYILPSAKMQVDMSRAMRDEIGERLLNPSIDMFKRISQRVRHGMLQDSMPRFVKSTYYNELKKLAKQFKEVGVESDLKAIDAAAKKGKLELAHLDMLLQNQLSMKQFRLFLESQHCAENLMLYEEIEHFRRLPSYQIVLRSAKKIFDKYLNPSNTRNPLIPVSEALRNRVVEQLEAASRTTFDEVENECGEFMRNVVVPDFLDSRIFMALVGTWAIVDEEYPAEMLKGEFEMAFLRHRFHLVQESRGLSRDTSTPKGVLTG